MIKKLHPVHPGNILNEKFLLPNKISQNQIARAINVPPRRINEIILNKRKVTASTALRLGVYFKTSAEYWMDLQSTYDLAVELVKGGDEILKKIRPCFLIKRREV